MFTLVNDHRWLLLVMAVWGCGVGVFMSTFNLVMVHYMGLDKFMPMLGATMLCIAGGYLTIGPFVGKKTSLVLFIAYICFLNMERHTRQSIIL